MKCMMERAESGGQGRRIVKHCGGDRAEDAFPASLQ